MSLVKLLKISYKDKEIGRSRVLSPLILIGRSPLCDLVIRAPGIASVHFIMEWIGGSEFDMDHPHLGEWVITQVGENSLEERKVRQQVVGQGVVLEGAPVLLGDVEFSWVNDRLTEANLGRKIISQQIGQWERVKKSEKPKNPGAMLEVICLSDTVNAVTDVQHFSFLNPRDWKKPLIGQFQGRPEVSPGSRIAHFRLPTDCESRLIKNSDIDKGSEKGEVSLGLNDILHIKWHQKEYYFRVVPRVFIPSLRKTIWSDPFYLISTVCLILGVFGFYLLYQNIKNKKLPPAKPPRIARINIIEPAAPKIEPKLPEEKIAQEDPPRVEEVKENEKAIQGDEVIPPLVKVSESHQKNAEKAPAPMNQKQGGLNNKAEKAPVPKVGFLAALRKTKNVGMVTADQVINQGIVAETVSSDKGKLVLSQTSSGIVTKGLNKLGDAMTAASSKVNLGDKVGSGATKDIEGLGTSLGGKWDADYGFAAGGGSLDGSADGLFKVHAEGGLDRAAVQAAIRDFKGEIRNCYEKALRLKSIVGGRVVYRFQIKAQGNVEWIRLEKSDVNSPSLVACVQGVVKGIPFPKAKNGSDTVVIYPFQFARKGE